MGNRLHSGISPHNITKGTEPFKKIKYKITNMKEKEKKQTNKQIGITKR